MQEKHCSYNSSIVLCHACGIVWLLLTAEFELNCSTCIKKDIKIQCDSVGGDIDEDSVMCFYDKELRSGKC